MASKKKNLTPEQKLKKKIKQLQEQIVRLNEIIDGKDELYRQLWEKYVITAEYKLDCVLEEMEEMDKAYEDLKESYRFDVDELKQEIQILEAEKYK